MANITTSGLLSLNRNKLFNPLSMTRKTDSKKYTLLARMMKLTEQSNLRTNDKWSPKTVFRIVSLADLLSVETKFESLNDFW